MAISLIVVYGREQASFRERRPVVLWLAVYFAHLPLRGPAQAEALAITDQFRTLVVESLEQPLIPERSR
jgi:hypothetical protein